MRGQGSLELVLIVAIVVSSAAVVFMSYSAEAQKTVAETTLRSQVEMVLNQGRMAYPECANAVLVNITHNGTSYNVTLMPPQCGELLFPASGCYNCYWIQGRITEALGCQYDEGGLCKGKFYKVSGNQ